jgi:hypothetical protein
VDGDGPWTVPFPGANPSEAIARCAGELDEIDPYAAGLWVSAARARSFRALLPAIGRRT